MEIGKRKMDARVLVSVFYSPYDFLFSDYHFL